MPWCPVCKSEYREGFTVCARCGVELVDELDSDRENIQAEKNSSRQDDIFNGEVLIANINDPVELTYLTSMFKNEGIAYRIIDGDTGQYLQIIHGRSFFGKAIYEGKNDFDRASDIYSSYKAQDMKEE